MTEEATIFRQNVVRQFARNELAGGIARVIAFDPGQYSAQRRCQLDERSVLLAREIILFEF